ncbi:J domain-containing protein required for chloroplast accumulation response 1-like isoform X2 [Telopea speciosissima]|uniref:J domain-containing protein required for chloroplast accumulation response 1-like isoform X2 n=1 Tax=Telopea speciosissima TaxID=54955 RepID=UPI001CC3391F|nr:J domain-containing protein required for chloroplast accumulation response 1-like isoform X2 [Telopea speciosissima]
MERFSYRDHILFGLGHRSPRRSLGSTGSSSRNSDEDFSDVFGGPPRRSSVHRLRHSLGNTPDSYANGVERSEGEGKVLVSRSSWSVLKEKPVFGEEDLVRRRYPSDDFLDDIFRGDQSSSPTPRKSDRDTFSSTPASRIQSPVRPLASKPAQLLGPSSLPRQLSLPSKLAKGMDFLVCGTSPSCSPYRSKDGAQNACFASSPCARVSNQMILQGQEDLKFDAPHSYRQSPLSHEFPLSSGESSKATKCGNEEKREHRKKISSRSEMLEEQCHFSIYKWASKGVPIGMPFRGGNISSSKERGNGSSSSSSKERGKSEIVASELSIEIPSLNDRTSSLDSSFHIECENQGSIPVLNSVAADTIDSFRFKEKPGSPKSDIEPPLCLENITTEVPHSLTTKKEVKETNPFSGVSGSSPGKGLLGGIKKEESVSMQEGKAKSKSLRSMFYENSDGQGKDGMVRPAEGKKDKGGRVETIVTSCENIAGGKRLETQDKRKILDLASNSGLQGTVENSRDKFFGNKFKEKIKEFVRVFNQEAPPNHIINVGTQGFRWKEKGTSEADDGARDSATKADGKKKVTNLNMDKTLTNGQAMVDQTLEQPEKSHFILNNGTQKAYESSSGRTGNSASCSGKRTIS